MRSNHQLVTKGNALEPSSNRLTNTVYPSCCRTVFSIVLMTCLSFTHLPAVDTTLTKNQKDFYIYSYGGDCKKLQLLLDKKPTDLDLNRMVMCKVLDFDFDETALTFASKRGDLCVVKVLLKAGADPNKIGTLNGVTPLMSASRRGHLHVVKALLKAGADPNKVIYDGRTALNVAVLLDGNSKVVKALLKAGADPNKVKTCDNDRTALALAASVGHIDNVKALLKAGANPSIKNLAGKTAFDISSNKKIKKLLQLASVKTS